MANTRDIIGDQATVDALVANTLTGLEESGVTTLEQYALYYRTALTSLVLPNVSRINTYGVSGCTGLTSIVLPACNYLNNYAFVSCTGLTTVDLSGTGTKTIRPDAFNGCSNLQHLIIRSTAMSTLSNTSAFTGTPIQRGDGAIYVPTNLVSAYKANSNWKNYCIADIDDYPLSNFDTISDSWSTILTNANYSTDYAIGDTKTIDMGTLGNVKMEIVAFDTDDKADNSGKAKITWISKTIITTHRINATGTTSGGWTATEMRSWLKSDVKPLIPETVRNAIVEVTKISSTYESAVVKDGQSTTDDVWIPSDHEVGFGTTYETTGPVYSTKFSGNSARIKYNSSASASNWWLRSAFSGANFRNVNNVGSADNGSAGFARGVAFGFCTD